MKKSLAVVMVLLGLGAWVWAADDDGMGAALEALTSPGKQGANQEQIELRDTRITADKMEYNYKEAVAIMTDNVVVDDARFYLTADRLFVFMDGTNSLSQLVVLGNVNVKNENRRASCDKAVYTKSENRLVLVGNARLVNADEEGHESSVSGDKITIWTDDQRMEVYPRPVLTIPAGATDGMKGIVQ